MFSIFKKFFAFAGKYSDMQKKGVVFAVLHSILEAFQLLALAVVLQAIIKHTVSTATAWTSLGIMLASVIGTVVTGHISKMSEIDGSFMMCADKRIKIGDRMKYMPMGYFNSHSLGNITAAVTTTMSDIEEVAPRVMEKTMHGFIHAAIISIAMMIFDWRIGLIVIGGIALFMGANAFVQRKSREISPRRQAAQANLVGAVLEYVQGMSVVKAFHLVNAANKRIDQSILDCERNNFGMEKAFIRYFAIEQLILRLVSVVVLIVSIAFYLGGTMSLAHCILMLVAAFIIYSQLEVAGSMSSLLRTIDVSIDRVDEIHQTPVIDAEGDDHVPRSADIEFKDVSFSYENRRIIDNVSFIIPQGTTTAMVGPSGGGKTTLCNLIARFWDVDEGVVTIGGRDVREYTLDSLLRNISMVFQNVYLFNDTIANNIKFGKPEATMEEVIDAAKKACCHDFIMSFPEGYDTVIGESGATLSGGEKQRISIARAMLKDASIIILDEATANVDPENESKLQAAIASLTRDKTIVMIAHRLKTVRHADQILVVDDGRIVQSGTHSELMGQEGIYADFIGIRKKAIGWKIKADPAR